MKNVKRLLAEVPHWCTEQKAEWIYNKVIEKRPALCVEIGVFGGGSFFAFALAMKKIGYGLLVGVDPWCEEAALQGIGDDFARKTDFEEVYQNFMKVREREKLIGFTHVFRERAENIDWFFENNYHTELLEIDILHIDGNHSTEAVTKDLIHYIPRVKYDGIIILDDINWPTVAAAIEKFPQLKQIHDFTTWGVYEIENRTNHT